MKSLHFNNNNNNHNHKQNRNEMNREREKKQDINIGPDRIGFVLSFSLYFY